MRWHGKTHFPRQIGVGNGLHEVGFGEFADQFQQCITDLVEYGIAFADLHQAFSEVAVGLVVAAGLQQNIVYAGRWAEPLPEQHQCVAEVGSER